MEEAVVCADDVRSDAQADEIGGAAEALLFTEIVDDDDEGDADEDDEHCSTMTIELGEEEAEEDEEGDRDKDEDEEDDDDDENDVAGTEEVVDENAEESEETRAAGGLEGRSGGDALACTSADRVLVVIGIGLLAWLLLASWCVLLAGSAAAMCLRSARVGAADGLAGEGGRLLEWSSCGTVSESGTRIDEKLDCACD